MRPKEARRDVVGFVGDGSYLYYPQSVQLAASLGVDLTVVVVDNRNYRILKDNQRAMFGREEDEDDFVGMDFDPPVDIAASATANGVDGRRVDPDDDLERARQWVEEETESMDVLAGDSPQPSVDRLSAVVVLSNPTEVRRVDELQGQAVDAKGNMQAQEAERDDAIQDLITDDAGELDPI